MREARTNTGKIGWFPPCMRWLAAIACLFFTTLPAPAANDPLTLDLTVKLEALQELLNQPGSRILPMAALVARSGLNELIAPQSVVRTRLSPEWQDQSAAEVEVGQINLRLALTLMSQGYGFEDDLDVLLAQPDPSYRALVIRRGAVSLGDLRLILQDSGLQSVAASGPLTLKVPLIIWEDASLQLRPGEHLVLSRSDGALLINLGHLGITGASISSIGPAPPASLHYAPFVVTAGGGSVQARDAKFKDLGFGITSKFAGFSILGGTLRRSGTDSWVENSTFDGLTSVMLDGISGVVLRGNLFRDMRGSALIVTQSRGTNVLANLFTGSMRTNAIRIENGSAKSVVSGNIILSGERTGIVVRNNATHAEVSRNIIWRRTGGGIAVIKANCGLVTQNYVLENRQKGIEVRSALGAVVDENTIVSNQNAGVWVSAQAKGAQTLVRNNRLSANGSGVASASGEYILLDGNDFTLQFPQFFSNELSPYSAEIAQDLTGQNQMIVSAAGRLSILPSNHSCDN